MMFNAAWGIRSRKELGGKYTSPSGYLAKNGVDPHIPARKLWLWVVGELGVKQVYLGESWADHNTVAIGEAAYPEIRWGTVTTPSNLDWTIARVR